MKMQSALVILNLLVVLLSVVETVSVQIRGENVYTIEYQEIQYFMFIEDKEATISCTVKGTTVTPNTSFKKEGKSLHEVLPETLYKIERFSEGQTHILKLKIDASGYTDIVGNWTCEPGANIAPPAPFKTLLTSKPDISFSPPLMQGVARMGTTITLRCNCDTLDEFADGREWNWFIDNATPAGAKISYTGPGSETGYPTDQLVISDLDELDTAGYRCVCIVGANIQFTSNEVQMSVMRPPGKPKDIVEEGSTMNSLSITWSNSEDMGVVLGYQISYKEADDSSYRQVEAGSEQQYTLQRLSPLTSYNIKIAASNNAGSGSYSDIVTFTTAQPRESKPVISKPKIFTYDSKTNVYLKDVGVGVDISLTCQVNSYPASMVHWTLDGSVLATEPSNDLPQNYDRSVHTLSQFITDHVLIVRAARTENSGLYSCTASNTKGKEVLTFQLRVEDETDPNGETDGDAEKTSVGSAKTSSYSLQLYLLSIILLLATRYHTLL